jgi:hypothetical protein
MPLPTRATVRTLADDITAGRIALPGAIDDALDAASSDAALALMLGASIAGKPPSTKQVALALPMLDDIEAVPPLVAACVGDRVSMLLDVVERDQMGQSRDALALLFACSLLDGAKPPPRLAALLRRQARRSEGPETAAMLLAVARALGDVDVVASVCAVLPYIDLPLADDVSARWRDELGKPLLDALPDEAAPRVVASGFTARRTTAKVGRNDPCPCGSGKKYKKCHEAKDAAPAPTLDKGDAIAERLRDAAPSLTPDQVSELRAQELARLDLASLASPSLVQALRRFLVLQKWKLAENALGEIAKRPELGAVDRYRDEIIYEALYTGDAALAKEHVAQLIDPAALSLSCKVALDLLTPTNETLARLEEQVALGLRDEDTKPDALFDVAEALLMREPAIGIVFARGVITPTRDRDSATLLEVIEEARDRLALAPGDPAGAIYDAMLDVDVAKRAKKELDAARAAEKERTRTQSSALRKKARAAAARVEELEAQLQGQQAALARSEAETMALERIASTPADEEERRRLRMKLEELKGRIDDGNKERAELRKELAQRSEALATIAAPVEEPEEAPDSDVGVAVDARVRGVAVPRFARSAADALREVPARIARDALLVVADLAAGDAAAWREVKQLEKASTPIFSARIGIHYRLLFRTDATGLEVLELFHRKNLESTVKRYA